MGSGPVRSDAPARRPEQGSEGVRPTVRKTSASGRPSRKLKTPSTRSWSRSRSLTARSAGCRSTWTPRKQTSCVIHEGAAGDMACTKSTSAVVLDSRPLGSYSLEKPQANNCSWRPPLATARRPDRRPCWSAEKRSRCQEDLGTCVVHPASGRRRLIWINLLARSDLGLVAKLTWAIAAIVPLVPFVYVLTSNDLI
jgi:hypothetical protein